MLLKEVDQDISNFEHFCFVVFSVLFLLMNTFLG